MLTVGFYSTRPYDREYFEKVKNPAINWVFHEFSLNATNAITAQGMDAVCVFVSDKVDRACLEQLQKAGVRHIALRCAGFNNIDCAAAKSLGITVSRVPAYSPHAVAEHALALLLTLNRKTHRAHNRVREQNFSLNGLVGFDIFGKTVGIIGTGKIGRITAEIFKGFGATIKLYDLFPDAGWAAKLGAEYTTLPSLLAASDIVSLHTPLTPETQHLVNSQSLASMKTGAYLINTSRGGLVDTTALISALKSGKLGGVGLDVYEEEDGIFYKDLSGVVLHDDELARLLTFPNVLITSHQAFLTAEALAEIAGVTTENLTRLDQAKPFLDSTQV